MGFLISLTGIVPAIFFMWLVERYDQKRPEPLSQLRKVALLGGLSTIPCILAQLVLDAFTPAGIPGAFYESYISAALTEETAKAIALYLVVWRHPAFDERVDGIVYATRAGLGFALVENVSYLLREHEMGSFVGVYVMRALLSVPGHAIYAGFMGYWAGRKKFDNIGPGLMGGLIIAILLHGTYDASLFLMPHVAKISPLLMLPLLPIPLLVVIAGGLRLRRHGMEALRLDSIQFPDRHRLPPGIGFILR